MASPNRLFDMSDVARPPVVAKPEKRSVDGWFGRAATREPERLARNGAVQEFLKQTERGREADGAQDFDRNDQGIRKGI